MADKRSGKLVVCRSYKELDRVIKANAKATYDFALALYEMRESRAYREKYGTFEDYCWKELGHHRDWAYKQISAAEIVSPKNTNPGMFSTGEIEWPTPPHIIAAAVAALGSIDVDPCASAAGHVPASTYFTVEDDGLSKPWLGRVYMNPPYGRVIGDWVEKLHREFTEGGTTEYVALVPARTDTAWFDVLREGLLCFIRGRLKFGDAEQGAPFPSVAAYRGPNPQRFALAFADHGDIWERVAP